MNKALKNAVIKPLENQWQAKVDKTTVTPPPAGNAVTKSLEKKGVMMSIHHFSRRRWKYYVARRKPNIGARVVAPEGGVSALDFPGENGIER